MLQPNSELNNSKIKNWDKFSPNETAVIKLGMFKFREFYQQIVLKEPISTVIILDSSGRVFSSAINSIVKEVSHNSKTEKPDLRFFATRRDESLRMVQNAETSISESQQKIKKSFPNFPDLSLEKIQERAFKEVTENEEEFFNRRLLRTKKFLNFTKEEYEYALKEVIKKGQEFYKNKMDGDDYKGVDYERRWQVYANILKQAIEFILNCSDSEEGIKRLQERHADYATDRDILFIIMNLIENNKLEHETNVSFEDILKLAKIYIQELESKLSDIKELNYSESVFKAKNLREAMKNRAKQILKQSKGGNILIFDEYLSAGSSFSELTRAIHLEGGDVSKLIFFSLFAEDSTQSDDLSNNKTLRMGFDGKYIEINYGVLEGQNSELYLDGFRQFGYRASDKKEAIIGATKATMKGTDTYAKLSEFKDPLAMKEIRGEILNLSKQNNDSYTAI